MAGIARHARTRFWYRLEATADLNGYGASVRIAAFLPRPVAKIAAGEANNYAYGSRKFERREAETIR
ncbi:MAG: hypothetical protein JJ992_09815 [Planctomycetes bacterium]|nr:hypothetical protein [Planctomycetota bacterium]